MSQMLDVALEYKQSMDKLKEMSESIKEQEDKNKNLVERFSNPY